MQHVNTIMIFSDTATVPQNNLAIGAFACLDPHQVQLYEQYDLNELSHQLANILIYQSYESNKSTWSEIKTVIAAFHYISQHYSAVQFVEIYTDCQALCDLLGRRKAKLLSAAFITKSGKVLQHAELYKELYQAADTFQVKTFKMKGHAPKSKRLTVQEKIFDVVDKLSRKKLRHCMPR